MERVKVNLPEHFSFSTTLKIRITDLNLGGHVGNDTFLSLLHDARHQYLQHLGYSEMVFETHSLIMSDAAIEYKKELSAGDEVQISLIADGFDKYGFDIFYKIDIVKPEGKVLAAKAKTGMLCFDYAVKKVVSLPATAVEKMRV